MSKLDQIQDALKQINDARFQKLCDAYLHRQGYERINTKGSVVGKEKTAKGRPDSWIRLSNGNYVFAEYTTVTEQLVNKLSNDLDGCFDESKTGVPVSKIEKVILCHNSSLEPAEEEVLDEKCLQHGVMLEIIGIVPLSFALFQKYQSLAKEFLGIEVDTGQILSQTDFVTQYQNAFGTPLDTQFHFREEELEAVEDALENGDLIIITGRAGIGKSRFALECSKRFSEKHTDHRVYCIFNKGLPIYEDLKAYFGADGNYLILIDDANRVSQLDQILWLLDEQNTDRRVKIIVTVRDYAFDKVNQVAKGYSHTRISLDPFDRDQLQKFLSIEFGIKHSLYLDRIWDISRGNPRLAVMSAQVALREQRLDSIADVSALYDEYFSSLARDFNELGDQNVLRAAGIISFFGFLDRTMQDRFNKVAVSFGISGDELWRNMQKLHELEVVDLYENEIVKISDQVLSTYCHFA